MGDTAGPCEHTACPRCGYDLRGIIETWRECCDVHGRCAECGLAYEWSDVLSPTRRIPGWFVENGEQRLRLRNLSGTSWRTFVPWNYWHRIRMSFPIMGGRIAALIGVALALHLLIASFAFGYAAYRPWAAYVANGWTSSTTGLGVFLHAQFMPWSNMSPGTLTAPNGLMTPIPTPAQTVAGLWSVTLNGIGVILLTTIICTSVFILLPQTRKRCQVRLVHPARVAAYSLCPILLLTAWTPYLAFVLNSRGPQRYLEDDLIGSWVLATMVVFGLHAVWWWCAIARYMKLPHAPFVAMAVVLIGWLTPLAALVLVMEFIVSSVT